MARFATALRVCLNIVWILWHLNLICDAKRCDTKTNCTCLFDDGTIIDITSLGNKDRTPRFKDVPFGGDNFFSYNPCYPFSELSCSEAASCLIFEDESVSVQAGDFGTAAFQYNAEIGRVVVAYTSGVFTDLRVTEVILVCDSNACQPSITIDDKQPSGVFKITLTTVCACPNGCDSSGPKSCNSIGLGLSPGTILCIAFFSTVIMYFVIGTLVLKFGKKKEGIEVIPNITFWLLVKEGVMFLISKVRRRPTTHESI